MSSPMGSRGEWGKGLPGSETLLQAILESASQAILIINREGDIVGANGRAAEMFGYCAGEMLGRQVEDLAPQSVREAHRRHRAEYFEAPRVRPMGLGLDLAAIRKDGAEFPVEISLSYVQQEDERFGIAFVSDITVRKKLEEQLVQSQKMEAVGRLAGGIAHDFNNLLTVIEGFDRLLLDKLSPRDPLRGYAEEILKAAERAAALTKQLLTFSRRQVIKPQILDVNASVLKFEGMLRRLAGPNLSLVISLGKDVGRITADPSQIDQVLLNLFVNARDAMPNGGRIVIETSNVFLDEEYARSHAGVRPGPYVMIAVSDNGGGMDRETLRHIFEPFFTTKDEGTGLGLATVYGIVKQNGGDIWAYSELGAGSTFKIYWPRTGAEVSLGEESAEAAASSLPTETILVAEDEEGVRRLLREVLREQGYTVLDAADSMEALQIAESHEGRIDLLITDMIMPHSRGQDLAEQLRASRPKMKVLYMSGYTANSVEHHGILDPGFNFLAKPFAFDALLSKVRQCLGKK